MSNSQEETIAEIEILYQQSMTVRMPVQEMPASPEDAWYLIKDFNPEAITDALPADWDDATLQGDLNVVDIREGEPL